jgi:hypothetical protein
MVRCHGHDGLRKWIKDGGHHWRASTIKHVQETWVYENTSPTRVSTTETAQRLRQPVAECLIPNQWKEK